MICRSGSVYAVVELEFGSTGSDPLKPLTDELNDGKLGSFTVDRHLNPTIEPNTLSAPSRTTECKYAKVLIHVNMLVIIVKEKLHLDEAFS